MNSNSFSGNVNQVHQTVFLFLVHFCCLVFCSYVVSFLRVWFLLFHHMRLLWYAIPMCFSPCNPPSFLSVVYTLIPPPSQKGFSKVGGWGEGGRWWVGPPNSLPCGRGGWAGPSGNPHCRGFPLFSVGRVKEVFDLKFDPKKVGLLDPSPGGWELPLGGWGG